MIHPHALIPPTTSHDPIYHFSSLPFTLSRLLSTLSPFLIPHYTPIFALHFLSRKSFTMFDDSVSTVYSSIWSSMNSWFTPTVLFVLLNVMIGTIAFTSSLANNNTNNNQKQNHPKQEQQQQQYQQHEQQQQPTKITRSPSILQRIKSINFSNYRSQEPLKNYIFDHSHSQETTTFEPQTHYIFEPPVHEQSTVVPETSHYIFNQENAQKSQTQYLNMDQDFNFQQSHERKIENMTTHFDFQQPHEEKVENMTTHFVIQPPHEEKVEKMSTHFDFQQPHDEEEYEEEGEELKSLDEVYSQLRERHVSRSRSDTKPAAGEAVAKLSTKMKKSASMKSPFAHFEEEDIVETRRPATTREKSNHKSGDGDNEVDAKADDFINKFKQQLKLQRLDSILRYKEMIGRGGS